MLISRSVGVSVPIVLHKLQTANSVFRLIIPFREAKNKSELIITLPFIL